MHIIFSMIAQTSSPTTKGINAIQLWILGCVIFSFLSLIEFVVMLIHMRHKNKKHVNGGTVFDNFVDPTNNEEEKQTTKQHLTKRDLSNQDMIYEATHHENLTLFGYPTFFLIYVGFYLWVYRKTIICYIN